jgi:extracellular matrix regulatory protein B
LSPDEIKSYVITTHHIYASPISSTTLKKRADLTQKI